MRIYTSHDGAAYANALSTLADGTNVEGHEYVVVNGAVSSGIHFQHGPVPEVGHNGVTNEQLLAILIHRTEYLNSKFSCPENVEAIAGMQMALDAFEQRTAARLARGVEGTHSL